MCNYLAPRLPKLDPPTHPTTPGLNAFLQISNTVSLSHNSAQYSGGVLYVGIDLPNGLLLQVRRQGSWRLGRAPRLYAKHYIVCSCTRRHAAHGMHALRICTLGREDAA